MKRTVRTQVIRMLVGVGTLGSLWFAAGAPIYRGS